MGVDEPLDLGPHMTLGRLRQPPIGGADGGLHRPLHPPHRDPNWPDGEVVEKVISDYILKDINVSMGPLEITDYFHISYPGIVTKR